MKTFELALSFFRGKNPGCPVHVSKSLAAGGMIYSPPLCLYLVDINIACGFDGYIAAGHAYHAAVTVTDLHDVLLSVH